MSFAAVHRPTDRQTVAGNRHRLCVRECSLNFGSNRSGSDREDGSRAALAGREELGKASKGDKFICRQLDGHSSLQLLLSLSLFLGASMAGRKALFDSSTFDSLEGGSCPLNSSPPLAPSHSLPHSLSAYRLFCLFE